jgi:hypothetical protein
MSFGARAVLDRLVTHAESLGRFESVNSHEPKSAPGLGHRLAIWADKVDPVRTSGLDQTSARVTFLARIYQNMISEPQDAIDPDVLESLDVLMAAYSSDFDLGGSARHIDLLGAYGVGLSAQAGYISQDGRMYRVMTVTVPVVVNDAWTQGA